jgi:hypothetical protein
LSIRDDPGGAYSVCWLQAVWRSRLCPVILVLLAVITSICPGAAGQDAQYGVALPVTFSAGFLDTQRAQYDDPTAAAAFGAFRLLAVPEIKLGSHWYGYGALQLRLTPYFYQDAYDDVRQIKFDTLQAYLGYSRVWNHTALGVKVGKLASAFGAFPLHYDDMVNPLLDQPLQYNYLLLQPVQSSGSAYGLTPVTIYGLPAAEIDLSRNHIDSRFQLTNSSPYNPRQFFASNQHAQWTAGGGYTIIQGLRVGVSAYRGPWLSGSKASLIPAGLSSGDFPASAVGFDVEAARGHWSAVGEWDRFVFDFPRVTNPAPVKMGYAELKRIITPRWYSAVRLNYQSDGYSVTNGVTSATTVYPNRQYYEVAVGFRPDRFQLLKIGYEWAHIENGEVNHDNVFGVEFVSSFNGLSKALK